MGHSEGITCHFARLLVIKTIKRCLDGTSVHDNNVSVSSLYTS